MKNTNFLKYFFWILFWASTYNLSAYVKPPLSGLTDRKWDLKQMYINKIPIDSIKVSDMALSLIFTNQNKFYQIAATDLSSETAAIEGYYSIVGNSIVVAQTYNLANPWYNFNIVYIGDNHLVMTFTQPDPQNPSSINTIEFRFVADNSIESQ